MIDPNETNTGEEPMAAPPSNPASESVTRLLEAIGAQRQALDEILREHQDLQDQNTELVQQLLETPAQDRLAQLEQELRESQVRYDLLRSENQELTAEYQRLVDENNKLFKLYVASHRLHSSLAMVEVLEVISEIIINLIGSDRHAIFFFDEREQRLAPVYCAGVERDGLAPVGLGEGVVGQAALADRAFTVVENQNDDTEPLVVIPIRFRESLLGTVVIYSLLSHKQSLGEVDYALFEYLTTHAAMAIHSAKLYADSEQKITKMKEFLKMMQTPTLLDEDFGSGRVLNDGDA